MILQARNQNWLGDKPPSENSTSLWTILLKPEHADKDNSKHIDFKEGTVLHFRHRRACYDALWSAGGHRAGCGVHGLRELRMADGRENYRLRRLLIRFLDAGRPLAAIQAEARPKFAKVAKTPAQGPYKGWEVGGGRTTRQPTLCRSDHDKSANDFSKIARDISSRGFFLRRDQFAIDQDLGDLNRVQRRALARLLRPSRGHASSIIIGGSFEFDDWLRAAGNFERPREDLVSERRLVKDLVRRPVKDRIGCHVV
jgi:hypothetical protein